MSSLSNAELEARIQLAPDDLSAYLVYSDWLTERGDPRGELIAVQVKLEEMPEDPALLARDQDLRATHAEAWLGPLAKKLSPNDLAVGWRRGFLDRVHFGPPLSAYEASELDFAAAYDELMTVVPSAGLVRELVFASKADEQDYQPSWQREIDAMVERGVPAVLRRLSFQSGGFWDISSTSLGDLETLYPRLGSLRQLAVHAGSLSLGVIALPELESIEIETGGLTSENVAAIAKASWPNLERLSLYIGESDNDYGCDVGLPHLVSFLTDAHVPRLRHLGLCNTNLADALVPEIARAKLLPQLESLDLGHGTFGDVGARAMLEHRSAFAHLKRISLSASYVSDELADALQALGPEVELTDRRNADEDDRYVQISE